MEGYEILAENTVKIVWKADEYLLRNQRIASKIFNMLKLPLQAIAIILNVQSQVNCKSIRCNMCAGLIKEN